MAEARVLAVKRRRAVLGLLLASLLLLLAASVRWGDWSIRRLRTAGAITIGYAVEAPYAYVSSAGEGTGESPELAKLVTARLGIKRIIWRQAPFEALLSELHERQIDVIASGMFVTPERRRLAAFSVPTFHVRPGLLVRRGNPRHIASYRQLAGLDGVRVAVLSGSVEEAQLRRLGVRPDSLVAVPDALTGRVAVESGVADALALSAPSVQWMALSGRLGRAEAARLTTDGEAGEGLGAFAFRRGDRALRRAWDQVLRGYVGTPEHLALVSRFGFTAADLPGVAAAGEEPQR